MDTDSPSIRFYVKYLEGSTPKTVRFGDDKTLLDFVQFCAKRRFAIIDTHMAFYDVELIAPDFAVFANTAAIDHADINLAKDGEAVMIDFQDKSI